jgi:uncharacterized protein YciI
MSAWSRSVAVVPYFVVISEQGPTWADSVDMRQQDDWAGHASFMNGLADEGFVVLGGPIDRSTRHSARLIVRADSEGEVRDRLARDPWAQTGVLTTKSVEEWEVLLGGDE